jgi:hypothetical protein
MSIVRKSSLTVICFGIVLNLAVQCSTPAHAYDVPNKQRGTGTARSQAGKRRIELKRTYREGVSYRYEVTTKGHLLNLDPNASSEDRNFEDEETVTLQTKIVKSNGEVTLLKSSEKELGGLLSGISVPDGVQFVLKRDRFGRLLSLNLMAGDKTVEMDTILNPQARMYVMIEQFSDVLFPRRPVAVGETWQTFLEHPLRGIKGAVAAEPVKVRTTLLGSRREEGKNLWLVRQTAAIGMFGDPSAPRVPNLSPEEFEGMEEDITTRRSEAGILVFRSFFFLDAVTKRIQHARVIVTLPMGMAMEWNIQALAPEQKQDEKEFRDR